ncbi:MAG: HAMP domain-containing histidine kinase, partial [Peptococcaceae bacterium]|nr:HAMP domain-containing histidine kinase [Peptococcaceae bacterium]
MTAQERDQLRNRAVTQNRFPPGLFAIFLGVMFLMSGLHVGLIVLMNRLAWGDVAQVVVAMGYWALVAAGLTWITRRQIETVYDKPARELAEATAKVADGDFSVYVPTVHTADKYDYLDIMILDFNKMVEELGSIETLKTDFVSNVSHEMKTPIAVIKNYAELLQSDHITEEERKEYAAIVEDAAGRMSTLISNILRLNKLEHQRITASIQPYDLTRQLYDCILQFETVLDEKELEIDVDTEDRVRVNADESLMELVWNNLLSNAVKFTGHGGTVRVVQRTSGSTVKVTI